MDKKEFLRISYHLDEIGAFSVADQLEEKYIKLSQVDLPKPRGGGKQGFENFTGLFGRRLERGMGGYRSQDYIPDTHGEINAIADWAKSSLKETNDSNLKQIFSKIYNAMLKAKNSIVTIAKRVNAPYEYTGPGFFGSIGGGQSPRQQKLQINPDIFDNLKNSDFDRAQEFYYNWNMKQKDIYNDSKYISFLNILDNAAILISAITNSKLAKDINSGKVKPLPRKSTTPSSSGQTSSGEGTKDSTSKPKFFDINKKLFEIVYSVVKKVRPEETFQNMEQVYQNINNDYGKVGGPPDQLKNMILKKIDSSSYSAQNKAIMKDRFLKKVSGTYVPEEDQFGPSPQPSPEPIKPSPFPSEQNVRGFAFLEDEVRKLSELEDSEFLKVFDAKSNLLNKQIIASYQTNQNTRLTPEEHTYLIGALDRMKLRFQKLLQGM